MSVRKLQHHRSRDPGDKLTRTGRIRVKIERGARIRLLFDGRCWSRESAGSIEFHSVVVVEGAQRCSTMNS